MPVSKQENLDELYDVLNDKFAKEYNRISVSEFTEELREGLSFEHNRRLFSLLKNIVSLNFKYREEKIDITPAIEIYGEGRTFGLQDMEDDDYELLQLLDLVSIPKLICVRVAEILWMKKKEHKVIVPLLECYVDLYRETQDSDRWYIPLKYIKRAIVLASQTGQKRKSEDYKEILYNKILEFKYEENVFFVISAIEFLLEQKWKNLEKLLGVLDCILNTSFCNVNKIAQAYDLKAKIYIKLNRKEDEISVYNELADYFVKAAEDLEENNVQSLFTKEKYLEKAIKLYRENGQVGKRTEVTKKLLEIQRKIPSHMLPISIDNGKLEDSYTKVRELFENLSFKEFIMMLIRCVPFYKEEEIKKQVLENAVNPLACLFGIGIKNGKGNTVVNIPNLDIQDPEKDKNTLIMHMHHNLSLMEEVHGNTTLRWAIDLLNKRFEFEKEDLRFLVRDNPIIPVGREEIFLSGIYFGLKKEFYIALHILSPQMEKLFRNIAESVGGMMTKVKSDGTAEEKLLSEIFEEPELIDCYDNDILFLFKGLMNKKTGANIRNEIAHGIMSQSVANGGKSIFFICATIKLISYTSGECLRINDKRIKE